MKPKCELLRAIERDLFLQSILELAERFKLSRRQARNRATARHLERLGLL